MKTVKNDVPIILVIGKEDMPKKLCEFVKKYELIKTVDLQEACDLLFQKNLCDKIWIRSNDRGILINKSNILYIETENRKLKLVTKYKTFKNVSGNINGFIESVNTEWFCRCHKSYAININNVVNICKINHRLWEVSFDEYGKIKCPVGNVYKCELKEKLMIK